MGQVKMIMTNGITFDINESLEKTKEEFAYAIANGALLDITRTDEKITRYVNPFQILYIEGTKEQD